ncbi:uroporphyrinogen-III C-methyltransferase [Melioribacteraceae bacterium 4301-Me]|uniref:uroporphyrinogen-III C-methyltransferase n=1 Tax=Pyranulibacter aquaticus TaxID=3163344 RepID=UPI00359ACB94
MHKINSLPVLLKNPKILLIGGGKVALQKIKVLLENDIEFFVITEKICAELINYHFNYSIKKFEKKDAENYNIIINASGNNEVKAIIKEIKRERFILVNTVDVPEECDFYFSSLLIYKNLKVAVSSNGASPTITQIVRDKIKNYLPTQLGELAEKKFLERTAGIINPDETKKETLKLFGKVYLIGCGIGGIDMLTLRAYNLLQNDLDLVLYDHLITEDILGIIPKHVEKIYVGKCKGRYAMTQDEINKLLLNYAQRGMRVGRLKNGDPFLFGRGSEEAVFLINHNIEVEIIPGVPSVTAAPLSAGIPITAREISSSVSIVTAHLKGGVFDSSWIDLLKRKNHTTIVLMGLTQAENIINHANKNGVDEYLPTAVISNAGRNNQKVLTGSLKNLVELSNNAEPPAVLVFGNVVNFSNILPHFRYYKIFEELNS